MGRCGSSDEHTCIGKRERVPLFGSLFGSYLNRILYHLCFRRCAQSLPFVSALVLCTCRVVKVQRRRGDSPYTVVLLIPLRFPPTSYPLFSQLVELFVNLGVNRIQLLFDRLLALRWTLHSSEKIPSSSGNQTGTYLKLHLREFEHQVTRSVLDPSKSDITLRNSFDRCIMVPNKISQHRTCLVERTIAVILAHAVLLQEVVLQHASYFKCNLVVFAKCALSDELNDFR